MPRAGYSQQQADEMLERGRVFYLTDTPAAAIVVGRENGTVVYNFLDDPADNRRSVRELYHRIRQVADVHPNYLEKIKGGYKMGRDGKWVAPNGIPEEGVWYDTEEATTDISRFHGDRAGIYRDRRRMRARTQKNSRAKGPSGIDKMFGGFEAM